MRVPRSALRSRIVLYDFAGNGSKGPVFGMPRTVRASVQAVDTVIVTDIGEEHQADVLVLIRPEDGPVTVQSKVEWLGGEYRVAQAFPMPDDFRPTHWELKLRRWAAA